MMSELRPIPPLVSSFVARQMLAAIKAGDSDTLTTFDLGHTEGQFSIKDDSIVVEKFALSSSQLKKIIKRDTVVFAIDDDGPYPIEFRDNGYSKLVPLTDRLGAPTFELSGVKMHRTKGIDPFEDARTKAAAVVHPRDSLLDTCGGMGYTAIWARRIGAQEVTSSEINNDVIALRKYNPWSREYLEDEKTTKLEGDINELIGTFPDNSFDSILHDPPRFSLAGELYGEIFIGELARVLRPGGRLSFYTGEPYRTGRGRAFVEGVEKRLRKANLIGSYQKDIQAIVARLR
jgi:predicted methyltransferase